MFIRKKKFLEFQEENAQLKSKVFNLENDLSVKNIELKNLTKKYDELVKKYEHLKNGGRETGRHCGICKYGIKASMTSDITGDYLCGKNIPCGDYKEKEF